MPKKKLKKKAKEVEGKTTDFLGACCRCCVARSSSLPACLPGCLAGCCCLVALCIVASTVWRGLCVLPGSNLAAIMHES